MDKTTAKFWEYVKSYNGVADIQDVFLKWAATSNFTINEAQELWQQVNVDVHNAFNKTADISISGPKEEVEEMIGKSTLEDEPTSEITPPVTPPVTPPAGEKGLLGGSTPPPVATPVEPPTEGEGLLGGGTTQPPPEAEGKAPTKTPLDMLK